MTTTKPRDHVRELADLVPRLCGSEGFDGVLAALQAGDSAAIDGAWGSSCALATAAVATKASAPLLIVVPRISEVDDVALDLAGFLPEPPVVFPAWESLPEEHDISDAVFGGRLRVLSALDGSTPPAVIVTCFPALLQPVPSRSERERGMRGLSVGEERDPDELLRWLVERGFERVPAIEVPGEFSMHGGIVDLFPPDATDPFRIEFFGDEIESIRRFDVLSQRKLEDLKEVQLTLVAPADRETNGRLKSGSGGDDVRQTGNSFVDSLPPESWIVLAELADLVEEGKSHLARLDDPRGLFSAEAALARCTQHATVTVSAIAADSMETTCRLQMESIERFTGPRTEVLEELASIVLRDERVLICCHNEGERERLAELMAAAKTPIGSGVELCLGTLTRGFRIMPERLVVLGDHELFGRAEMRRLGGRQRRLETRAIDSFLELNEGDLVVHLTNGIGRYLGMQLLDNNSQHEEHLIVEFRDGVRVFVPVSLIHLVQKYVGAAKAAPRLSKIGGQAWAKKKQKVASAVNDMASEMLRLQAAREAKPGIAFPTDSHWQNEFDAAFPYVETKDQVESIIEVKHDMQQTRPMDRLICGDVGYGKTEVAMRAAFKAIDAGKQVAVLVPTTVLAEQHFRTFCERMAEYPITIESLSRFKTKTVQRGILDRMQQGSVELVIGTHRLAQKDVQFKDLGLLIIDEEQRFGVETKEMLKRLRLEVDVLTLSATPIPRTLHMSILGVRDISNLTTAPQDRQAIETRICRFDKELIRNAVVRELNRNGQVFFVHNRVHDIQAMARTVEQIVPEARVDVGHGQMREGALERSMLEFVTGRTDVFVCTTIIESGLDIPNANTIIIHQADKYGLADLHQLRGRVGRDRHRAYCYLMVEQGRTLTSAGAKRLKAIEEFSELGAGFKIAMRDLEIRGAGNILGTEQSGHISLVGYELYCQLLENAVRALKNEPKRNSVHVSVDLPVSAHLPNSYVPPGRQKIEMYRKFSNIASFDELAELEAELRDRFGPSPQEACRLLELKRVELLAFGWQIEDIRLEERFAVFGFRDMESIRSLARLCNSRLRVADARNAYLVLESPEAQDDELLAELKSVLQREP